LRFLKLKISRITRFVTCSQTPRTYPNSFKFPQFSSDSFQFHRKPQKTSSNFPKKFPNCPFTVKNPKNFKKFTNFPKLPKTLQNPKNSSIYPHHSNPKNTPRKSPKLLPINKQSLVHRKIPIFSSVLSEFPAMMQISTLPPRTIERRQKTRWSLLLMKGENCRWLWRGNKCERYGCFAIVCSLNGVATKGAETKRRDFWLGMQFLG
jgi:hypothetical protein